MNHMLVGIVLLFVPLATSAEDNPWVAMTRIDLHGIHDILRDNHPGPIDPENPRYRQWLEEGLTQADARAKRATSFADYIRALEFYTNGFQDDHIGIGLEVDIQQERWPGFAVKGSSGLDTRVVYAEPDAGVPAGARLVSCDRRSLPALMAERVEPYFWNSAIPHQRYDHVNDLFHQDVRDPRPLFKECTFSSGIVALKWRVEDSSRLRERLQSALAGPSIPLRIARRNGVWLVSIPTFDFKTDDEIGRMKSFLAELKQKAPELGEATVVFDVRGNDGGDSAWGERVIAAFWGEPWVDFIRGQFDGTADWRASPQNLRMAESNLKQEQNAGLSDATAEWTKIRDGIKAALDEGRPYARIAAPPSPESPRPEDPVRGRVYFLTDGACKSACLDFADMMLRLPAVVHVGLPTGADAIYIDNTYLYLPSGLAGIGYSMKVYRNRSRKNNEWYDPRFHWPGGDMTDDSVTKWIASLH
jgi:hypothetical protein